MSTDGFEVTVAVGSGPRGVPAVTAVVVGDLDGAGGEAFEAALDHRLDAIDGPADVAVDLTAVPHCDSTGTRSLLDVAQRVRAAGGRFVLRGADDQVARTLRSTGPDPDDADALDAPTHG